MHLWHFWPSISLVIPPFLNKYVNRNEEQESEIKQQPISALGACGPVVWIHCTAVIRYAAASAAVNPMRGRRGY